MPLELKEIDKQKVGFFRFKQLNGQYLITNDIGDYSFLTPQEFDLFLSGRIEQACVDKYSELQSKGFIRNRLDFDGLAQRFAKKNMFLDQGPSLHIVVVTLKCDHRCIYCQVGSQPLSAKGLDMNIPTAQKVVDIIFESLSQNIMLEFQGGEPLVNWDATKFIIGYAQKKNKIINKKLLISLVSNLSFMNQKRLKFLINNNVSICTSLDGVKHLHNKNRPTMNKKQNSYRNTIKWIKAIQKEAKKNRRYQPRLNALITITKDSLRYPKGIIDEYLDLGLDGIHLRPVNSFGIKRNIWQKINFSEEDFLEFYKKVLDYVIKLNIEGKKFYERTALIFLTKMLTGKDPNFLDIRSPCGAGIGQLAYNYNGDIYTCDEGRMLSRLGDESFRVGNVEDNTYQEIMNNPILKTMCVASCLDNLAECNQCVYKPYCGICPVYNYVEKGDVFNQQPNNRTCTIHKTILDYLFERLKEERCRKIFGDWIFGYPE